MTIQAIFFDMGGTIETFWHTRALRLKATPGIQKKLLSAGINLHLTNSQLFEVVSIGLNRYHQWRLKTLEELPTPEIWRQFILTDFSYDPSALESIAEDLMLYIETHYYHRKMRPEVPATLDTIRQMGIKIGLISNVSSRSQVPTNLEVYGIRDYFNPVVLSSEYGRRKPDPAIFHYAARLAQVPTSRCIYVGDRISRDIVGARKAGYRLAIQIQHDFEHGEDDAGTEPDATISNMIELIDILKAELDRSYSIPQYNDNTQSPIRAFIFDAGDVLYYRPQRNHKFIEFLKSQSIDLQKDHSVEKSTLTALAFLGKINQDQYRESIIKMYGVDQPDRIELGKQLLDEGDNDIQFIEGVQETLLTLKKRGYLLGVITDTANPLYIKLKWLERGGIGHVWDTIISSKELGICKPDPRIYQAALSQLGLLPAQSVFVGHRTSELDGAKAVDILTIAFNYEKSASADFYIKNFSDLLDFPDLILNGDNTIMDRAG